MKTERALDILGPLFVPLDEEIHDWTRVFFNGSWGPKREEREMCERANRAIGIGAISVTKSKIPHAPLPSIRERRLHNHPWNKIARSPTESDEHQRIKYSCLRWLASVGIEAIGCEVRCPYGLADISLDGMTVECGSTPPRRFAAIGKGLDAAILIPYGSDPEDRTLAAYLFSLGEGWVPVRQPEEVFDLSILHPAIQPEGGAA